MSAYIVGVSGVESFPVSTADESFPVSPEVALPSEVGIDEREHEIVCFRTAAVSTYVPSPGMDAVFPVPGVSELSGQSSK